MGQADLEFAWSDMRHIDPKDQATILDTYVKAGIYAPNEARAILGLGPVAGRPASIAPEGAEPSGVARAGRPPESIARPGNTIRCARQKRGRRVETAQQSEISRRPE